MFGRNSDFDSAADTVVRTQAYRLRQRLKDYYAGAGDADGILIDVPKGHYKAAFSRRTAALDSIPLAPAARNDVPRNPVRIQRSPFTSIRLILAGVFLLITGVWAGRSLDFTTGAAHNSESRSRAELDGFWNAFLGSDRSPIVAYSNDLYLTTEHGTLLQFSGPTADRGTIASREVARQGSAGFDALQERGPLYFEDDKTDVGEVVAATALTAQLERMGVHPVLKRGRVITTFDLESHNVIFLGSPFANKILSQMEGSTNFVFRDSPGAPSVWGGVIYNLRPQAGELNSYALERDPKSRALKSDYAIVSRLPGLAPGRRIMILAGLTTSGTQAAAQFVTSASGIEAMASRMDHVQKDDAGGWPSSFEYLLKVTLNRGLDVLRTECISSRNLMK